MGVTKATFEIQNPAQVRPFNLEVKKILQNMGLWSYIKDIYS